MLEYSSNFYANLQTFFILLVTNSLCCKTLLPQSSWTTIKTSSASHVKASMAEGIHFCVVCLLLATVPVLSLLLHFGLTYAHHPHLVSVSPLPKNKFPLDVKKLLILPNVRGISFYYRYLKLPYRD